MSVVTRPALRTRPLGRPIVMSDDVVRRRPPVPAGISSPVGPALVFGERAVELARSGAQGQWAARDVQVCSSWIELIVSAQTRRPSVAVVEIADPDPVDAHAQRAIARLRAIAPAASIVAVIADPTPDCWVRIRDSGAEAIISPGGATIKTGRARWSVPDWEEWLLDACGLAATADTEAILALLAPAGERSACADDLVQLGYAASRPSAVRRLREVTKLLGGEEYRSPGVVAQEARRAIAGLAAARPLLVVPTLDPPILTAARCLERSPSIAVAAGLTAAEIDALRDIATRMAAVRRAVGAPHSGASRDERAWAAGRRAAELGADPGSISAIEAQCLADAQGAALSIGDALHEMPGAPRARLAAAVEALAILPVALRPPWTSSLTREEPGVRDAKTQAPADQLPDGVARRLTVELDQLLRQHRALDRWVQSGCGGFAQR